VTPQAELEALRASIPDLEAAYRRPLERILAEIDFAARMADAQPDNSPKWWPLITQAARLVAEGVRSGRTDLPALVSEAEAILSPLGPAAKEYAVYCCGHAHIDMNWMWTWPETVSVTYDTFSTMDQLMDEFPEFHFTQSQASVYVAMQEYAPELFERIKKRVAEGRWEVAASQWVEGSKNLASGEILCRHLLYTRRWLRDALGLPFDAVKIDWEPDTFGHCWTLPGILTRGGVTRYYHHRASGERLRAMCSGESSQLFWWEGKDGSRVLAFDDSPNGYNNEIVPRMTHLLFALERHTGLKSILWVYGVGDHGGGPTRRHLRAAQDMAQWPIWPRVKLTTTDAYFTDVEREIAQRDIQLPVHADELNFVFEGCYTSVSRIKFANRQGENDLVDTEVVALAGHRLAGLPYPSQTLTECWRRSMFIQFHDILPGSGVLETREHAMGLFQENLANTGMVRSRALRAIAQRVNTRAVAPARSPEGADQGLGAGVGNGAWWGSVSAVGAGACGGDPFVVFNPCAFPRDELVTLKVWNRELPDGEVTVRDAQGHTTPGQVIDRGHYWGHQFTTIAFPARDLPAMGYRAYVVDRQRPPQGERACYVTEDGRAIYGLGYVHAQMLGSVTMGNELLEMVVSPSHGGVISLIDKASGTEFVPPGEVFGCIDREQEAPHGMTAWQLGAIIERTRPLAFSVMTVVHQGPNLAAVRLSAKHGQSQYDLTIALATGQRRVDFELTVNWLERGDPSTGVPALRASFPVAIDEGQATFEIPFGTIERPTDGEESPALNWADLSGSAWGIGDEPEEKLGITLLNNCKYGHQAHDDMLRLTLIRSSYDPDPLPELGLHRIGYAIVPHTGPLDPGSAARAGYAFNHPCIAVSTTVHEGELPPEATGIETLTPNVLVAAVKKAEDSGATIIRLYEIEGRNTDAQIRLAPELVGPTTTASLTDILEQPLPGDGASICGGVLTVTVPAFGIATVRIGE